MNKYIRQKKIRAFLLLAPAFILICLIFIYPIVLAFRISFFDVATYRPSLMGTFTLSNYIELFKSPQFYRSLWNTLIYTLGVTLLALIGGMIFALGLEKLKFGRRLYRTALGIPWIIPSAIVALVWRWIFEPQSGIMNYLLSLIKIGPVKWIQNPAAAMITLIIVGSWHEYPYFMITCSAGLKMISQDLHDAAAIDGAASVQRFRYITLPALGPVVGVAVTLSSLMSFREYDIIAVLTGGGPAGMTQTFSVMIYKNAFQYFKMGFAASIGIISFLISIVFVVICLSRLVKEFY
jgi:multiple sugar transport system permease protein